MHAEHFVHAQESYLQHRPSKEANTMAEPDNDPQKVSGEQTSEGLGIDKFAELASSPKQPSLIQKKIQWSELSDSSQKEIKKDLFQAIIDGRIKVVKELANKYEGLRLEFWEYTNDHGDNPLHLAAFHGHLMIVKYLIEEKEFHRECCNRYRNTPLHRAARQGNLEVVEYLINEKDCDTMCTCNWGRTPLHNACKYNRLNVVKVLMDIESIEFDKKDKRYGSRPLDLAAQNGAIDVVRYMIEEKKCYDPTKYKGSYTPLHYAAYSGTFEVVQYLVANQIINCDEKGAQERTPLHSACKGGHFDVVKYLIKVANANSSFQDHKHGLTPLDLAAEYAPLEVVKYMLEKGRCQVIEPHQNRYTTLHYAAYGGRLENVKFLIEGKYLNADCKGLKGKTPLHSACRGGKNDVVEYLIYECGIDPLCRDDDGNTPLHSAVRSGNKSVVTLLLTDSDPSVTNYKGVGPLAIAKKRSFQHISTYLEDAQELLQHPIRIVMKEQFKNVTKVIPTGKVITKGAFSYIGEFKSPTTGEMVAGKVFKIDLSDTTKLMEKMGKIKNVPSTVRHENILESKGVCFIPERIMPVLLMERITHSLRFYIQADSSPLSMEQTIGILQDTASALSYLHSLNPPFIHGHLTPDTVLLDERLKAKIGSFAIESVSYLPNTSYMPPEAEEETLPSDPKLDVFSFGHLALVTLLQKEVGPLLPFQEFNESSEPIIRPEVDRRAQFIENAKAKAGHHEGLVDVMRWCLQNKPVFRPSMEEVMEALQQTSRSSNNQVRESGYTLLGSPTEKHNLKFVSENDPRFPGVEFFGKPFKVTVTAGGAKLKWREYGIEFDIPTGAVQHEKRLDLKVWPCTSDAFKLPQGYEFASPVYLIEPSFPFSCDIQLKMHHFFNLTTDEDHKSIKFLSAPIFPQMTDQKQPQYHFRVLEKGVFGKSSKHGTISLKHFCFAGCAVYMEVIRNALIGGYKESKKVYAFHWYQYCGTVIFTASRNQPIFIRKAKECMLSHCPEKNPSIETMSVTFREDKLEFDWPKNIGWNIISDVTPCEISQAEMESSSPPIIKLTIQECSESDIPLYINLKGTTEEAKIIVRAPHNHSAAGAAGEAKIPTLDSKPSMAQLRECQTRDGKVINIIKAASSKWSHMGDLMNFDPIGDTVSNIKATKGSDVEECCRAVFHEWLKGNGIKPVTWRKLLELLESCELRGLADEVRGPLQL